MPGTPQEKTGVLPWTDGNGSMFLVRTGRGRAVIRTRGRVPFASKLLHYRYSLIIILSAFIAVVKVNVTYLESSGSNNLKPPCNPISYTTASHALNVGSKLPKTSVRKSETN